MSKKSPKALRTQFSPVQPAKWYVYIQGICFGNSADVKRRIFDAITEAAEALPGVQELSVTAQASGEKAAK